jgi:hypothetical protein
MKNEQANRQAESYGPRLSRRESLKWLGALLAGGALTTSAARHAFALEIPGAISGHWPALKLPPVTARGYGQDPDLMTADRAPWPTTLTVSELATVGLLADILVPREGKVPSASELHVPDVVDEWVSAPYAEQQQDRLALLSLLQWLDDEAELRFGKPFAKLRKKRQLEIVDDIAWYDAAEAFRPAAAAFERLRAIVVAAFYCSPEGHADIGYLGGVVIPGDYPGPTREAEAHLAEILASLGLEPYEDRGITGKSA